MQKDTIRICLLGGSGSGKTTFFSGVYQSLISGVVKIGSGENSANITLKVSSLSKTDNFFNTETDDDGDAIQNAIKAAGEMDAYMIRKFGGGTVDSTEFTFELRINSVKCCDIVIIDYAGETIDNPDDSMMSDYLVQLSEHLAESDAVIIITDAAEVAKNYGNLSAMNSRIFASRINAMYDTIAETAAKNGRSLTTLIALTKSDHLSVPPAMKRDNFSEISHILAEKVYARTYVSTVDKGGSFGIIPVTAVGEGSTDEMNRIKDGANIQQKNIDTALLFCIYNAASRLIGEKDQLINATQSELKKIRFDLGKKAKEDRAALSSKLALVRSQRDQLANVADALTADLSYFSSRINEMVLADNSEIGEASRA